MGSDDWISVDERLPDEGARVAVGHERCPVAIAALHSGKWFWSSRAVFTVTHWQPLPAPPEATQ